MVEIIIKVDDGKFRRFIGKFPGNLVQAGIDISDEMSASVLRRARYRATTPRGTGYLASQIKRTKIKEGFMVESRAGYSAAVEFGFKPHWIPFDYILQHGQGIHKGVRVEFGVKPWIYVIPTYRPFMRGAVEAAQQDFIKIAERAMTKAIAKSG